jgi:hypothetical protein
MKRRDWLILLGFLGLTLLLRLGTFHKSVIDFDESYFLLLGRSILRGEVPYTTLWEHSPPGGFVLFALIEALLGQSVLALRIATWLIVALEGFLLYRLGRATSGGNEAAGVIAGTLYAVFTVNNLGLAGHRELFLAPCVTLAVYLLLTAAPRPSNARLLLAGLAIGCALQLKYMYLFEAAAVFLIATVLVVAEQQRSRAMIGALAKNYMLLAVGPVLSATLPSTYFALNGHWAEFADANFRAATTYARNTPYTIKYLTERLIWQTRSNTLIWIGALLAPIYLVFGKDVDRRKRLNMVALLIWFGLALVGTMSTGRYWDHYYLQLVAPGSLLTALLIVEALRAVASDGLRFALVAALILVSSLYWVGYPRLFDSAVVVYKYYLRGTQPPADGPRVVSDYLRGRVKHDDAIFVPAYEPIIYYMVDARIPTKHAFPPHLTNPNFLAEGIDQVGEIGKALDKHPLYVIIQIPPSNDYENREVDAELTGRLARDYVLEKSFPAVETFTNRDITVEAFRLKAQP